MSDGMAISEHLGELRKRLMIAALSWLVAFLGCYSFGEKLFEYIAAPVRQALPEGSSLVFLSATEPFFTILKVSALAGLVVAFPIIAWQLWSFISPALYGTNIGGVSAMLSMGAYLTLSSRLLIAFGLVFELPIVIFFLARLGIVDHKWLAKNRKFSLLIAFIMGAVLTPPDIFSQASIAVPFVVLYEVGIIVARLFGKKKVVVDEEIEATE